MFSQICSDSLRSSARLTNVLVRRRRWLMRAQGCFNPGFIRLIIKPCKGFTRVELFQSLRDECMM